MAIQLAIEVYLVKYLEDKLYERKIGLIIGVISAGERKVYLSESAKNGNVIIWIPEVT